MIDDDRGGGRRRRRRRKRRMRRMNRRKGVERGVLSIQKTRPHYSRGWWGKLFREQQTQKR